MANEQNHEIKSFGPQFLNKQNEKDANEIARESMKKLDIHPKFWTMYPKELSSSSRKIVAIARALAVKPKIIIFDEPSTGLDIRASHKLDYLIPVSYTHLTLPTKA